MNKKIWQNINISLSLSAILLIAGCATNLKTTNVSRSEVGELTRAEAAKVISQQDVILYNMRPIAKTTKGKNKVRGITYFVKIERTGETLAITQTDDLFIPNGSDAWVQFGDNIRLIPKR